MKFAAIFFGAKTLTNAKKNLAVLRFEIPYERDAFRFNLLGTFRERTFKQVRNSSLSFLC